MVAKRNKVKKIFLCQFYYKQVSYPQCRLSNLKFFFHFRPNSSLVFRLSFLQKKSNLVLLLINQTAKSNFLEVFPSIFFVSNIWRFHCSTQSQKYSDFLRKTSK
jgi:hypothetical protein